MQATAILYRAGMTVGVRVLAESADSYTVVPLWRWDKDTGEVLVISCDDSVTLRKAQWRVGKVN